MYEMHACGQLCIPVFDPCNIFILALDLKVGLMSKKSASDVEMHSFGFCLNLDTQYQCTSVGSQEFHFLKK